MSEQSKRIASARRDLARELDDLAQSGPAYTSATYLAQLVEDLVRAVMESQPQPEERK